MVRSRVRLLVMVALAAAAAAVVPMAGARESDVYTIVGGTWVSGWSGQLVGPAWWLDGPTSTYGVTMVGPGGFTKHMGGPNQRFPGMPSTRSVYWCSTCGEQNPGGSWYAIGDGDHTNVSFTIDQTSRMQPVEIGQYSATSTTFTANWTADPSAKSFIVYIQDEGDTSATDWIVGEELPGSATSVTLDTTDLNPSYAYEFDIFAFSGDIVNGPPPSVFNIASNRVDFVPSVLAANGPESGLPMPLCCPPPTPCMIDQCPFISPALKPPVALTCSLTSPGRTWSASATPATTCSSARTVLKSYLVSAKCGTKSSRSCKVKAYSCASHTGSTEWTVRCDSSNRMIVYETKVLVLHG